MRTMRLTVTSAGAAIALLGAAAFPLDAAATSSGRRGDTIVYLQKTKITKRGVRADLTPIVRIVWPLADSKVAPGEARVGKPSPNGAGFVLNLEIVSRDAVPIRLNEATLAPPDFGIRNVAQLERGAINPEFPGLYVFFDRDLITPDGKVLPAFNNFAAAFNVAGTDDTPGPGVTAWAGWHVLESFPADVDETKLMVAVVDEAGRIGSDSIKLKIDRRQASGQALTPGGGTSGGIGEEAGDQAPEVSIIAPRAPTSVALGPQGQTPTPANGSLLFIHISALDRSGAGIAVNETGVGVTAPPNPIGLIFDPTQIPSNGPNRNFPGLTLTFDVPLRQPNGNLVPAGNNLTPLFDVAGAEIDATGAVRVTADWVVGGSLVLPAGKSNVTMVAKVTDNAGQTGMAQSIFSVSGAASGQDLTAKP
jgi:hypothetical protein